MRIVAKKEKVIELRDKFLKVKCALLTDYQGLTVAEITDLRNQLRKNSVEYQVVKNTLARIATRETSLQVLGPYFSGPTAVAWSYEDPIAPAKIISSFSKNRPNLKIKAGYLEGRLFGEKEVHAIAELPPKGELLSHLVGSMHAPLRRMVSVLQGTLRSFVATLDVIRSLKEKEEGTQS